MDMTKYAGAGFITFETVRGQALRETIAEVTLGQYGKPVLTFANGKMVSVNATNAKALIKAFGTESDGWIGQRIELRAGSIKFKGLDTDVVLIAPLDAALRAGKATKRPAAKTGPTLAEEMNDEVPFTKPGARK